MNRADQLQNTGLSEKVVWQLLQQYTVAACVPGIAPHDLRRTCTKLCRAASGERYLGTKHDVRPTTGRTEKGRSSPTHPETAQGFELDYVGVIFGPDLVYKPEAAEWSGDKTKSHNTVVKRSGEQFTQLVKNTYRVLLARDMKGCYVYFMDMNDALSPLVSTSFTTPSELGGEHLPA